MKKYKVGFVGTGARSLCYAKAYAKSPEIEVAAMADPSSENRRRVISYAELPGNIAEHDDWRALLAQHPDLDGVVVCTPNNLHRETAVPFIERGIPVALEKPIATTMRDAELILDAERAHQGRLLIGFVLRSTPYYRKIHELISSGAIGNVINIQADELASFGVSSIISRGAWRRYAKSSGGSMMEKSSHDMDILNYLVGSRPVAVNAFGGSLVFRPNPNLPAKCVDCLHSDCPYHDTPQFSAGAGDAVLQEFLREGKDRCIYNIDKDVTDNQSVNVQYANGAIANFMLSFNCAGERSGRNFHAVGTKGRIWGNIEDNQLALYRNHTGEVMRVALGDDDGVGHNGGDENHALELLKMMKDPAYKPAQGSYAGYLSNVLCIGADLSMAEGRRLNLRYDANGYVTFA